jgi:hypothetical protein
MKLILGHNQFFGIDHKSEKRGRKNFDYFKKTGAERLIKFGLSIGYDGYMLSTHDDCKKIYKKFLSEKYLHDKKIKKSLHIITPYANKINTELNKIGLLGFGLKNIKKLKIFNIIKSIFLKKNSLKYIIVSMFLDNDLEKIPKKFINTLYLHEILTDLLIALNQYKIIEIFKEYCRSNNYFFGLATRNFVLLKKFLEKNNIFADTVLTHINTIGLNMNPNKKEVLRNLNSKNINKIFAMGIFASGSKEFNERKIKKFISNYPNIDGMVIGSTKKRNIKKNLIFKND